MPVVVLEGPDCCGKSTLFQLLKQRVQAVYVHQPCPRELYPVLHHVAALESNLWMQLYDPARLYICDRHPVTSAWVYDRLLERCSSPLHPFYAHIHVLYIGVPPWVLRLRLRKRGDELVNGKHIGRLQKLYSQLLDLVSHTVLDGTMSPEELADVAADLIPPPLRDPLPR